MHTFESLHIDKAALTITPLSESDEKEYWLAKSPYERLQAVELMRQILYGYDPTTTRLQRILTVAHQVIRLGRGRPLCLP